LAKPLLNVGPGQEMESGLYPGIDPVSAPFWADGENVEFRKGGVVSSLGYTELASLPGTVNELTQAFVTGSPSDQRVYGAYDNQVFLLSSQTGLASLGAFPTQGIPYFETFGSWLLGTNFADTPRAWRNTGTFDEIAGLPFDYAKILHRKDNHVLAFNTDLGQNHYAWCSASDIDDWDPTAANSAGDNFIRDLDSDIVAVCDIGDSVAIYSRETMGLINFVGQPNVFSHRFAINGVGATGGRSVVPFGQMNAGLNKQGIFRTDGVGFQYVDEPAVHDFIEEDINFDLGEEIKGYHNEDLSSVIWFYTSNAGTRKGIGYNYVKGIFQKYTTPALVALERQVFPYPVAAIGNKLALFNQGQDAFGSAFSKWIRTKPLAAGDGTLWKNWSHLKAAGVWNDATVKFGAMEDPNSETIEWFSTQDLAFENWVDRDAPYLVLEFRAEALGAYFSLSQLTIQGTGGGKVSS
jgi:hypothetical protein